MSEPIASRERSGMEESRVEVRNQTVVDEKDGFTGSVLERSVFEKVEFHRSISQQSVSGGSVSVQKYIRGALCKEQVMEENSVSLC